MVDGNEDGASRRDIGAYEFAGFGAVRFAAVSASAFEGDGSVTVQALRYGNLATAGGATLGTNTAGLANPAQSGSDFSSSSTELRWAAGEGAAKPFTVPLLSDSTAEGDEAFKAFIVFTAPTTDLGRLPEVVVTIKDGSAPTSGGGTGGGGTGGGSGGGGTGGGATPVSSSGGGGAAGLGLLAVFTLLAGRRRRRG